MKKKILVLAAVLSLLVAGCSGLGGGGIGLKYDDTETSMEAKSAFVDAGSSGEHVIHVLGFPLEASRFDYSKFKTKADGQHRVTVTIVKKKASGKQPVTPGVYKYQHHAEEPKDKMVKASIYRFEKGKEVEAELDYQKLQGSVTIDSVDGGTVKGKLDVTDGKRSIKGDFTAKVLD